MVLDRSNHQKTQATEYSRIQSDKAGKINLKDKEQLIALFKFKLNPERFNALDFNRLKFIDTELLQKKSDDELRIDHENAIIEVGLKGMDTNMPVSIVIVHESSFSSQKELFFQVLRYYRVLLSIGIYPLTTIVLAHGEKATSIAPDLQTFLGWEPKIKELFGKYNLNMSLEVVDLDQLSDAMS